VGGGGGGGGRGGGRVYVTDYPSTGKPSSVSIFSAGLPVSSDYRGGVAEREKRGGKGGRGWGGVGAEREILVGRGAADVYSGEARGGGGGSDFVRAY